MDHETENPDLDGSMDDRGGRQDTYECATCGLGFEAYSAEDAAERHDSGEIADYDHAFVLAKGWFEN